jgi:hypothetical protein
MGMEVRFHHKPACPPMRMPIAGPNPASLCGGLAPFQNLWCVPLSMRN